MQEKETLSLLDILLSDFFQRALIGGVLIGITAPLIGIFLVLRRLSMIGDTLSHVTIAGVALGFLIEVYPLAAGLVFAVLASFAIEKLRKAYKSYAELSIAIIMSGGVALASLFFTLGMGYNTDVMSYLFGSIYTLDSTDIYMVGGVTVVVIAVVVMFFKEFFLLSFEEDAASVSGLPVKWMNMIITVLTALVVSTAIKIVGALLVSALLTIPVAISLLLARSFRSSIVLSVIISEIAVIGGLMLAGVFNLAPGATIVLLLISLLIITLVGKKGFTT
ncbi:metal ABC transporter permease [Paenibacillus lautus]|jgi:zinc transport system permease protein|uniref:metal ABC transporter permease n=1 Tax=Bacillales TaxID=1385 RepID=UPI0004AF8478|nr:MULTISPECIES: metal ABC transporter permease [Paenibacillus]MBY0160325.1 metal ABC transporter permease [Cytobacillus firmus]MCI1775340.1 metal ABC transporter permease [Paenibacillus lautus]MCM3256684.1 metal ABC transporter permease [Paenibacillus lautus]QOT13249.1 metal ABC transporter permease [Paenibacillus sp. JNUCC-32]WFB60768.1 metal ABC transporter permease [Paenibacillus sp. BR1-192]